MIEQEWIVFGEPDDHLDELILDSDVRVLTVSGKLPLFCDGFHWATVVRDKPRVQGYVDEEAHGVIDHEVMMKGTVEGILQHPLSGDTAVFVEPN
jgi:hypothetical protein